MRLQGIKDVDSVLHLHSGHDCLLISRVADGDFEAHIVVYWYIYKFAKRKRSVLQGLDTLTVANNGGEIQASQDWS